MLLLSGVFPMLYNTDQQVRALAPVSQNGRYIDAARCRTARFTMRAGGSIWVTFF